MIHTSPAIKKAEERLERVRRSEVAKALAAKYRREQKQREKLEREVRAAELKTQRILNYHLVGKTVESVQFDCRQEGTFTFTFTNGVKISFSAQGDDATYTSVELLDSTGKEVAL